LSYSGGGVIVLDIGDPFVGWAGKTKVEWKYNRGRVEVEQG
jgi:hypothetical protein